MQQTSIPQTPQPSTYDTDPSLFPSVTDSLHESSGVLSFEHPTLCPIHGTPHPVLKTKGDCPVCKSFIAFCCYHDVHCQNKCPVPLYVCIKTEDVSAAGFALAFQLLYQSLHTYSVNQNLLDSATCSITFSKWHDLTMLPQYDQDSAFQHGITKSKPTNLLPVNPTHGHCKQPYGRLLTVISISSSRLELGKNSAGLVTDLALSSIQQALGVQHLLKQQMTSATPNSPRAFCTYFLRPSNCKPSKQVHSPVHVQSPCPQLQPPQSNLSLHKYGLRFLLTKSLHRCIEVRPSPIWQIHLLHCLSYMTFSAFEILVFC